MLVIIGYLILPVISLLFFLFITSFSSSFMSKSGLPPSPFALPIIGHLHLLSPIPHQALQKLSTRYGPVFQFYLGSVPCVAVSSADMAKEFLRTHEASNLDRPRNINTVCLSYGLKDFAFAPFGSYWKQMKKLVMSELLNGQKVDLFAPVRKDEINRLLNVLSQNAKLGKPVNLNGELQSLTNNVISRMITRETCSDDVNEARDMRKLITEASELLGAFNVSDYIWFCKNLDLQGFGKKAKKLALKFDNVLDKIINEHEDEKKRKKEIDDKGEDLLDILLKSGKENALEIELTIDHIKAFILDLLFGGTETTALTVEWGLAEVINHPRVMKKVVEEIDNVVGKARVLEESDIQNLPYLQAIVKETLRLHPAFPMIPRMSTEDCSIQGYHIPPETHVYVNVWAINRDPKNWDDPLEFKPERFVGSEVDVRGQHFQMLPFGSGRRMCPGISLAMHLIQATLGAMVQCFEWKADKKGEMGQVDMEEGPGLSLSRAKPLVCAPVARVDFLP